MKFYLGGQFSFANRGCEALIRSTVRIIRAVHPDATFLCPSENAALDHRQWHQAGDSGVEFTAVPAFPLRLKLFSRAAGMLTAVKRLPIPNLAVDKRLRADLERCDAVLMMGGDILSLDYGLFSLYYSAGLIQAARQLGKPTHLVAASVGPFTRDPLVESQMRRHLHGYTSITVRETSSLEYLRGLGLENVSLVADPAFVLEAEGWADGDIVRPGRDHLGLNVSPLVRRIRTDAASRQAFDDDIRAFVRWVVEEQSTDVVFVSHVEPLAGESDNSDRGYMDQLLTGLGDLSEHVRMTPEGLNAAQIKHAIGRCSSFIGARTHATIAALSQSVPTVSIAYSVKAVGINEDLFGSARYVLPTAELSLATLTQAFLALRQEREAIVEALGNRLPAWRENARSLVRAF